MSHNKFACVYNTLDHYNSSETSSKMRGMGIQAPVPAGTPSMKTQVVPVYSGLGYETLTHGGKCECGGHHNIVNAYPYYKNNQCNMQYVRRLCADNVGN
jgi:hypothetical protein